MVKFGYGQKNLMVGLKYLFWSPQTMVPLPVTQIKSQQKRLEMFPWTRTAVACFAASSLKISGDYLDYCAIILLVFWLKIRVQNVKKYLCTLVRLTLSFWHVNSTRHARWFVTQNHLDRRHQDLFEKRQKIFGKWLDEPSVCQRLSRANFNQSDQEKESDCASGSS